MERKEIQDRVQWVIVDKDGRALPYTVNNIRQGAIDSVVCDALFKDWKRLKSEGYTVRKVKLTEIK